MAALKHEPPGPAGAPVMPEPTPEPDVVTIVLRAAPDPGRRPIGRRVARLLKYALRACGLKCLSCTYGDDRPKETPPHA